MDNQKKVNPLHFERFCTFFGSALIIFGLVGLLTNKKNYVIKKFSFRGGKFFFSIWI